jgi:NADH-quinone oxidoreductase subunit N
MTPALAAIDPISTDALHYFPAVAPVAFLALGGVLIVLLRALVRDQAVVAPSAMTIGLASACGAAGMLYWQWGEVSVRAGGPYTAFSSTVIVDRFGIFLATLVCIALALCLLLSTGFLMRPGVPTAEYIALMLLSAAGMVTMTSANDLLVIFVALELLSIPLYVLAAFDRRRRESQEAGLKYFVLGAFASAIFLYGTALVYGTTGTTNIFTASGNSLATFFTKPLGNPEPLFLVGMLLVVVGFAFKVAAAPFHMWTPDVYQGAPTPVTAFMASATKVAGFVALLRLLYVAFQSATDAWQPVIEVLAVLSLVVGAIAALVQTDVKRILAYSSIANAGYILIAVAVGPPGGLEAALVYLAIYTVMIIGALAVVSIIGGTGERHDLDHYRGLARRHPYLAGALAFFLLAQAGVPFTAGFIAKLEVFIAAVDGELYWLAIVGMLAAAVAAFYYLRIIVRMYMADDDEPEAEIERPSRLVAWTAGFVTVVCGALTLAIGLYPNWLIDLAADAVLKLA